MFLSWKQERVPLKLQKLLVIFNRSSRLCSLCLVIDVSCKFCLLCWKLSSEHRGYSFPRVLYIFFSYCACSYARIISVQNPNPLNDCGQVSLVVTITVLQLKICLNNFSYETIWIMCNSASDPPPGTDILKLFPSPAWQWPVIYRLVFISQPPPAQFLVTPELLCSGARLEPAMLTPAWKGELPSSCSVGRNFSTQTWRSGRLTARHLQRLSIHLMAGKEIALPLLLQK